MGVRVRARGGGVVRRGVAAIALLAGAVVLAHGASAQAQTIGANLNRTPNVNFDCTTVPPFFIPGFGATSCTYLGTSATGRTTAAPFPGGVATRVRVRTGAPTGPMRVTIARAISGITTGFTCCFYAGQSQAFTPAANTTTAVNVRLPMVNELNPAVGQTVDYLAITVLNPGTVIPGQLQANISSLEGSLGFFPQIVPADAVSGRVDGAGTNLVPLLNADFIPLCGSGTNRPSRGGEGAKAEQSGGVCLGGVTIRNGRLAGSRARVPLLCNITTQCKGSIKLQRTGGGASAAKSTTVGKSKIKIGAGAEKTLKVKLSKAGRKLAKGKKKIKLKAKAKVTGAPNETKKVKLKR